jgi:thioredoxin 1
MVDLTHVTDETFRAEVLDSDLPVLVDLWADWCRPCHMIEPHVKAIAEERTGSLKVVKMNIDEHPATARSFGVMSIPTLLLFVDGQEKARLIGARPKEAILEEIEPHLGPAQASSPNTSEQDSEAPSVPKASSA